MSEEIENTETTAEQPEVSENAAAESNEQQKGDSTFYRVRFRLTHQIHSAVSKIQNLVNGEVVMVQTEHGPEPARIHGSGVFLPLDGFDKPPAFYTIARRASRDEIGKYDNLLEREADAFTHCNELIHKFGLVMKLIRVERFFNGSKIIFYFTAENRVDFRALVKELVQEFRTRVEMRQIGVRHETQMLGGLGCCGRELCCASFMTNFAPVSIKMAKEQSLPLNPSKISGACNRLLCCLTHEYETYKHLKKDMPKVGKTIMLDGKQYKVTQSNTLKGTIIVNCLEEQEDAQVLTREQWSEAHPVGKQQQIQKTPPSKQPPNAQQNQKQQGKKQEQRQEQPKAAAGSKPKKHRAPGKGKKR